MDAKKIKKAEKAYAVLCKSLKEDKWNFGESEKDYEINYAEHDQIESSICRIRIVAEREVVIFSATLPVVFEKERYAEAAVACCLINNKLSYGAFYPNYGTGLICFRMANTISDGVPGKDFFRRLRVTASKAIHCFEEQLLKLQKREIKATEILN